MRVVLKLSHDRSAPKKQEDRLQDLDLDLLLDLDLDLDAFFSSSMAASLDGDREGLFCLRLGEGERDTLFFLGEADRLLLFLGLLLFFFLLLLAERLRLFLGERDRAAEPFGERERLLPFFFGERERLLSFFFGERERLLPFFFGERERLLSFFFGERERLLSFFFGERERLLFFFFRSGVRLLRRRSLLLLRPRLRLLLLSLRQSRSRCPRSPQR